MAHRTSRIPFASCHEFYDSHGLSDHAHAPTVYYVREITENDTTASCDSTTNLLQLIVMLVYTTLIWNDRQSRPFFFLSLPLFLDPVAIPAF